MREYIFNQFKENIKIDNDAALYEYIDFCIISDKKTKIPSETEHHHILLRSLFPTYTNLKIFSWNGVHLLYEDHYKAHYLLTLATHNPKAIYAWNRFNKLPEENCIMIIGADNYSKLRKLHSKIVSENTKKSQNVIIECGLTKAQISGQKSSITKQKIGEDGLTNTQRASHISCKNKYIIGDDGLTTHQRAGVKGNLTKQLKNIQKAEGHPRAKKLQIYDNTDKFVYELKYIGDKSFSNINYLFLQSAKNGGRPIGYNNYSRGKLISNNHENYFGWYALEVGASKIYKEDLGDILFSIYDDNHNERLVVYKNNYADLKHNMSEYPWVEFDKSRKHSGKDIYDTPIGFSNAVKVGRAHFKNWYALNAGDTKVISESKCVGIIYNDKNELVYKILHSFRYFVLNTELPITFPINSFKNKFISNNNEPLYFSKNNIGNYNKMKKSGGILFEGWRVERC